MKKISYIFPFGDQMYLRSDCYHQYTPYLEILQQKLKDGGNLFYTWEIGAGMNFMAVAAYYLTSPLNLLAIIWPGYMAFQYATILQNVLVRKIFLP